MSSAVQSPKVKSKRVTNSPPKVVLNGKVGDSPKQKRKNNMSVSSTLSSISETQARSRQYEEESSIYPGAMNLPPSLSRRSGEVADSPVLPLSPDPFGRFPSSVTQNAGGPSSAFPERTSSLTRHGLPDNADPYERPPSKTPSSRFSADSVLEEAAANANASLKATSNRTTLVSMKSIKKLWRKTNKASVSASSSTMPSPDPSALFSRPPSSAASTHDTEYESSRAPSPSYPFPQSHPPMPSGRTSQASMRSLNTPSAATQPNSSRATKSSRPDSGLDPFYFDQDTKLPTRRSPSPQHQGQYGAVPYMPSGAPTPVTEKKRSVRKSILKWKGSSSSANGMLDGSADRRQSTDVSDPRRRRPSIIDAAGSMMRGSIASTSENSPSVPELPAEYRMHRQSRASVSTLQNVNGDERTQAHPARINSIRRKPAPSSSTDSSNASTDPIHTPVSVIGPSSIPNGNVTLASPRSSEDTRLSFDETQFEIVSPKPGQYKFDIPHILPS